MSDPAVEAAKQAIGDRHWWMTKLDDHAIDQLSDYGIAAAREALKPIRELHKPVWDNCINACCTGEKCRNRTLQCGHEYDEWPCATAKLIYTSEELS